MTESVRGAGAPAAYFHLPGLFEFYELYRTFLPLWREHREYFYDWCEIGSIYGAPAGCLWGGGRVELGERPAVAHAQTTLADIAQAQADFLAKTHTGKLVLLPPQGPVE